MPRDHAVIDGSRIVWRHAPWTGDVPTVYIHGVPTYSFDWDPLLARTGGLAPDLPGFGESEKAPDREQSLEAISRFVEAFVDHHGFAQVNLVVHDWGGAALDFALRRPERIHRLVIINTPFGIEGWKWHWIARIWRRPVQGEIFQATSSKPAVSLLMRRGRERLRAMPKDWRDAQWEHFDKPTRAAILRLYRSMSEEQSDAYARSVAHRFGALTAPTLVIWGERDPYIPSWFADAYAERLPNATVARFPRAGHWAWVDDPAALERAVAFLDA